MAQGAKTSLITKAVLDILQPELVSETFDLFEDNQRAIAIEENSTSGERMKHIEQHFGEIKNEVFFKERRLLRLKGPMG